MTIPTLMSNYRKRVTETRLLNSYAILNQALRLSEYENGNISHWKVDDIEYFSSKYILPYIKNDVISKKQSAGMLNGTSKIQLNNGTTWTFQGFKVSDGAYYYVQILIDINGVSKPNKQGIDIFNFYIFPAKRTVYNTGTGNCALNVPEAGLYYDGYGFSENKLKTYVWRGCGIEQKGSNAPNRFCIALIAKNNWKIPKDYPLKF